MMTWQDAVLGTVQLLFSIALIPSLMSEHKPALLTSLMTGIGLYTSSITFASLSLFGSAFTTAMCGSMWIALAWQKRNQAISERFADHVLSEQFADVPVQHNGLDKKLLVRAVGLTAIEREVIRKTLNILMESFKRSRPMTGDEFHLTVKVGKK
jgi:hypothetical protein